MSKNEEYYHSAFDNMMEGCQVIGFDWRYLYLNPVAIVHSRKTKEELFGKKYTDVWPGCENTELYRIMNRCLEDCLSHSFENEFIYTDGTLGWFELRIQPVPEGIFILSIDITARKKVERELQESEEKYRLISENSNDWIYWIDVDGHLQYTSPSCERVTGYSPEDFINNPKLLLDITYPEDKEKMADHFVKFSIESKPDNLDFRIITKTGEVCWISHSCGPMYNQQGKYIGRRGTNRNITERKQTENLLHESEEEFRSLFSNALNGVAVHQIVQDENGNPTDYIFLRANASFERQTGLRIADIIGKRVSEVIPGIEKTSLIAIYGNVALTGEPIIFEQFFEPLEKYYHINAYQVGFGRFVTVFQDITERKLAEEALRISEEKFRNIFEHSVVGKSMTTLNGKLKINKAFSQMLGYSEAELANINWQTITYPDDIETNQTIINSIISGEKKSVRWEKRYIHKNGNIVWVDISTTLLRDNNGNPLFFNTSIIDITERKMAQNALQQSEERYRSLLTNLEAGVIVHATDTSIIMNNHRASQLLGLSDDQMKGKLAIDPNWKFLQENGMPLRQEDYPINRIIATRKPFRDYILGVVQPSENNIVWLTVNGLPVFNDQNEIAEVLISFIDITERKVAEVQLRNLSKELEQKVIDRTVELQRNKTFLEETGRLAKVGGWEIDLITGKNYWTETTKLIHEVEPDFDPNLNTALNFYAPESVPKITACIETLISLGKPFDEELELITARKNRIWVRAIGQAYHADGKIVKIGGAIQDINEHKFAEQELAILAKQLEQRSLLLEESNKELESFSYSVSHDLRAPLRQINGFVDLLNERFYDSLSEKGKHYLDCISKAATQMGTLIDDLLQFSRTGRQEMRKHTFDMNKLVQEVIEQIKPQTTGRQIEWNINELPQVNGDPALLRLVWYNLLDNAIKFTRYKEKTSIDIGVQDKDNESMFFIHDNGAGFDMQYSKKLFGVFQRLHSSEEFEGTGIGLANVQRIIRKHGGHISAEAEPDKGATFYFTLPKK